MVVNDSAGNLIPRGVLEFIVGTPPGAGSLLQERWKAHIDKRSHA